MLFINSNQLRILLIGALWYSVPLVSLSIYIDRTLDIAIFATILLLLGWFCGGIFSLKIALVDSFKINSKFIYVYLLTIILLTLLFQCIAMINLQSQAFLVLYRELVFEDPTFLFGSSFIYTLYNSVCIPLLIIGIPFLVFLDKSKINTSFIYIIFALLIFDAVIKFGRFPLFYVLFFLLYFKNRLNIFNLKISVGIFLFAIAMLALLWLRQYSWISDFDDIFDKPDLIFKSFFSYNFIGFLIFNDIAAASGADISPVNFNLMAPYLYYFELLIGRFGIEIWYPWKTTIINLSEARYLADIDVVGNAFGTNLLPAYLDFGLLGPLILGFILGFLSTISTKGPISGMVSCIALYVMIFGIYKSAIVSPVAIVLIIPVLTLMVKFRR